MCFDEVYILFHFNIILEHNGMFSTKMKVVRLSALRTGRLYSSGNIPGTHFC